MLTLVVAKEIAAVTKIIKHFAIKSKAEVKITAILTITSKGTYSTTKPKGTFIATSSKDTCFAIKSSFAAIMVTIPNYKFTGTNQGCEYLRPNSGSDFSLGAINY